MTPGGKTIRITRGRGGEVEVTGTIDAFARDILLRAGFLFLPALRGHWIRLPFDLGRSWENEHAAWAADMLTTARYLVHLGPGLRPHPPGQETPAAPARPPAMSAEAPPSRPPRR